MNDHIYLYGSQIAALPFLKILKKQRRSKLDVRRYISPSPKLSSRNITQHKSSQGLQEMIWHYQSNYVYKKLKTNPMNSLEPKSSSRGEKRCKTNDMTKPRKPSKKDQEYFMRYEDIQAPTLKLKLNKLNTISYQDTKTIPRNCLIKFFTEKSNLPQQKKRRSVKLFEISNKQMKLEEKKISPAHKSLDFVQSPRQEKKFQIKQFQLVSKDSKNISAWAINTGKSFDIPLI